MSASRAVNDLLLTMIIETDQSGQEFGAESRENNMQGIHRLTIEPTQWHKGKRETETYVSYSRDIQVLGVEGKEKTSVMVGRGILVKGGVHFMNET